MKKVILLTDAKTGKKILIGIESIIVAKETVVNFLNAEKVACTEISSRHAMVTSNHVTETVEEIYNKCK